MPDFPGKGKNGVLKTPPETILEDYNRLMKMAGVKHKTILQAVEGLSPTTASCALFTHLRY